MSALLSQGHIENLRSWGPRRSYTDLLNIWKVVGTTPTRTGGSVPNYEIAANDIPCRVAPGFVDSTENTIGGQIQDVNRATVYTAPTLPVKIEARDLLEIQPNVEETEPLVINVTGSRVRRSIPLERVTTGLVVGGRGALPA